MDLSINAELYARMSAHQTENCGPLITPGDASQSALVRVLKGSCNGTDRMPYGDCYDEPQGGTECLSAEEIASIEQWVAAGAPEN